MSNKIPEVIGVYRITHIENLAKILSEGIYADNAVKPYEGYQFIGDRDLTNRRKNRPIPIDNMGTLEDYVPFYFGKRSPMLYAIHRSEKTEQEEIIYLLVKLDSLEKAKCVFCFTDGHAYQKITTFYQTKEELNELDWEAIQARNWKNTEQDNDRTRKKSAELLVKEHVPPECIDYIVTFNEESLNKVHKIVSDKGLQIEASSRPLDFYY